MFTLIKKMFGKEPAAAAPSPVRVPRVVSATPAAPAPGTAPQIAVANLSLAAILQKFPEDLRKNVASIPDASVTVALPLATINKQLAQGAVKMSLASLYRQAPSGTFREAKSEEKRMVEVPLSEVMRHVDVRGLRRRVDQRQVDLPSSAPQLFGDQRNPYAIAPSFTEEEEAEETPARARMTAVPTFQAEPEEEEEEPVFKMAPRSVPATPPASIPITRAAISTPAASAPPPAGPVAAAPVPAATKAPAAAKAPASGTLNLRLRDLCDAWPEPVRSEALGMADAHVALPAGNLAAALAKGKVIFTWGQLRSFLTPPPHNGTGAPEATELQLPLKIVAPAFMALSKPAARKKVEFDESIPAMFDGAPAAPKPPAQPAPEPAPAPAPVEAPKTLKFVLSEDSASLAPEPSVTAEPPVAAPVPKPAPVSAGNPLGDLFGLPEKTHWSVQEIIDHSARLPDVAGAVVCLQEGLLVAANLPPEMKGETMAAFIPQMFARLNVYTGEMKLAAVDDILMTINGAHFQAYRMGQVFFAVLGQQGGALPWESLRLVTEELAKQSPA